MSPAVFPSDPVISAGYADLDGNGQADVLVLDRQARVQVLLNRGAGFFADPVAFPVGGTPHLVANGSFTVGEFNGDGRADVAVAWQNYASPGTYDSLVSVLFGDGAGGLSAPQLLPTLAGHSFDAIRAMDLDADGRQDLALLDYTQGPATVALVTLHNLGSGSFGPYAFQSMPDAVQYRSLWADLNGDQRSDLVILRNSPPRTSVFLGLGNGTFSAPIDTVPAFNPYTAGDLNGDGKLDVTDGLSTFLGNGDGTFGPGIPTQLGPGVSVTGLADFDNDGVLDAITAIAGSMGTHHGLGNGTFGPHERFRFDAPSPAGTLLTVAADFDDDGANDILALAPYSPSRTLYLNDRTGHFVAQVPPTQDGASAPMLRAADVNGDARPDAVGVYPFQGQGVRVSLNLGGGAFATPVFSPMTDIRANNQVPTFGLADYNSDGRADLALAMGYDATSKVQILVSNGDGTFALGSTVDAGANPIQIVDGDFDENGKRDLLLLDQNGLSFFSGQGNGTFVAGATSSILWPEGYPPAAADFDGDGHMDVVDYAPISGNRGVVVYFGNGQGAFAQRDPVLAWPGVGSSDRLVAADVTGDGHVDVVGNADSLGAVLLLSAGSASGTLGSAAMVPTLGRKASGLAAGRFNGDGRTGIAALADGGDVVVFADIAGAPQAYRHWPVSGALVATDVDADGRTDLITMTTSGPLVIRSTACQPRRLGMVQNVPPVNLQGVPFYSQPVVTLRDDGNNRVCEGGAVTASLLAGVPGPALQGVTTIPLSTGQAAFSNLAVSAPGPLFRVEFTHGPARPTRSRFFKVLRGTISVGDVVVPEGGAGTVAASFPVTLSAASPQQVTVAYRTVDGTAVAPGDYAAKSGTLTFAPGETTKNVVVLVQGDIVDEADETFLLVLESPSAEYLIGDGQGQATIVDDDPNADVWVTKTDGVETAAPGQALVYTITVSNAGPNDVAQVQVSDPLPAGLTGGAWSCVAAGGGACGSASGIGDIADSVNLPVGASVVYTLSATVAAVPVGVRNSVTVALPAGYGDPDPTNNTAVDDDLLVCDAYTSVVADGRATPSNLSAGATAWYLSSLRVGSSYSLAIESDVDSASVPTATVFRGAGGCTGADTAVVRDTTVIDPGASGAWRGSFAATGLDVRYRIRVTNGTGAAVAFSLRLAETTLFSPAWSTNGSYDTYYAFQNTTGATVSGVLELRDTTGALVGTQAISVPPGRTFSTNTLGLNVARSRTGTASLRHDAPPGAVLAQAAIARFASVPAYVQAVRFVPVRTTR